MSMQADCVWPIGDTEPPSDDPVVAGLQELAARRQFDQVKQWNADRARRLDELWVERMEHHLKEDIEALRPLPETVARYKNDFARFEEFVNSSEFEGFSMPSRPACAGSVANWLMHEHTLGASYSRLGQFAAAVGDAHRTKGLIDPTGDILVTAVMRYAKRHPRQFKASNNKQEASSDEKVSG